MNDKEDDLVEKRFLDVRVQWVKDKSLQKVTGRTGFITGHGEVG